MKTIIASLFLALCCTFVQASDGACANGVCTKAKNTVSAASRQVVKTATRPVRRLIRGR
jgi:hypothetical protein